MVLFCAIAVTAFTMLTGVAFASGPSTESTESTATLSAGDLTVSTPLVGGTFAGTLTGSPQTLSGSAFLGFSITDATGSGVGWSVTMKASVFTNTAASGHAHLWALDPNSLTMPMLTDTPTSDSSTGPGSLHAAATIDNEDGVVMIACTGTGGQGMGVYNFSALASGWKLAVSADEYAGTYTSAVTTTLAPLAL